MVTNLIFCYDLKKFISKVEKVLYSPKFIESDGEEYQVLNRGREYDCFWEEYNVEKGMWQQYHLPYNIKAVKKNIKWGRGEGTEIK